MRRRRPSRKAFTLVELLVVVGIIAILIAITLPAAGKAREQGRRVVCASNLRQIATAATAFAADHDGQFPMSYGTGAAPAAGSTTDTDWFRQPTLINRYEWLSTSDADWKKYGTPWHQWLKYGADASVWKCPSSPWSVTKYNGPDGVPAPDRWGQVTRTDYAYVGGLYYTSSSKHNLGKSTQRWGTLFVPAAKLVDKKGVDRILAADAVYYNPSDPSRPYQINHPRQRSSREVDAQTIVYADGHVSRLSYTDYGAPINSLAYKSTLQFSNRTANLGVFFFGVLPPPPPPAGTPTPTPTTPTTPTVPPPPPPPPPPYNIPDPLP